MCCHCGAGDIEAKPHQPHCVGRALVGDEPSSVHQASREVEALHGCKVVYLAPYTLVTLLRYELGDGGRHPDTAGSDVGGAIERDAEQDI